MILLELVSPVDVEGVVDPVSVEVVSGVQKLP